MSLLELPEELKGHIASFVSPETLPTLRLVSRSVSRAAEYSFGEVYLSKLRCCILDASRLERVKRITSQDHLMKLVREVTFLVDATEAHAFGDIHTAASPKSYRRFPDSSSLRHEDAQIHDLSTLNRGLYGRHCPKELLVSILYDLKSHPAIISSLVLHSRLWTVYTLDPFNSLAYKVFEAFVFTACPIHKIDLSNHSRIRAARLRMSQGHTFADMCANIRSLHYRPGLTPLEFGESYDDDHDLSPSQAVAQTHQDFVSMLAGATKLTHLQLYLDCWTVESFERQILAARELLRANSLCNLQVFDLDSLDVDSADLVDALQRCRKTLSSITMHGVKLSSAPGRACVDVLKILLECPKLKKISIRDLQEYATDAHLDWVIVIFADPEDGGAPKAPSQDWLESDNRSDIAERLTRYVKRGVPYRAA